MGPEQQVVLLARSLRALPGPFAAAGLIVVQPRKGPGLGRDMRRQLAEMRWTTSGPTCWAPYAWIDHLTKAAAMDWAEAGADALPDLNRRRLPVRPAARGPAAAGRLRLRRGAGRVGPGHPAARTATPPAGNMSRASSASPSTAGSRWRPPEGHGPRDARVIERIKLLHYHGSFYAPNAPNAATAAVVETLPPQVRELIAAHTPFRISRMRLDRRLWRKAAGVLKARQSRRSKAACIRI